MTMYTSTGCNDNDDVDRDKDFISRFLCCHLPNIFRRKKRPTTQTSNGNSRLGDEQLCDAENTNSLDTMNGTASPKKTSFLARMKRFITTHKGKKGQKDSNSTHDEETLVPPCTSVGWKHKISLLLSLVMKNGNGSHRMNTKYTFQIHCLNLEDQKKPNETTQPFNIPWSLQDKPTDGLILFQTGKQGDSSYVKPAAHIRRRRTALERYSQFMSLSFSGDEDGRSCSSKILKLCNGYNKIQMIFFKKFHSLTHDWFRTVYSESMNAINGTVDNEDKNIGLLTSSETFDTEKSESSFETFPDINDEEIFEEAETGIISDYQILSQLEDTTEGFQDSLKEESHNHESNMLMQDKDHHHHHLSCSSESMKNPNLKYVRDILQLSGLLENDCFKAWHSLEQPLDPEMFDDIESSNVKELSECNWNTNIIDDDENMANCYSHHRKLLFDLTNEVLVQLYDRTCTYCPRYLSSKCSGWIKPFPVGNHLLKDVLANISKSIANFKDENALDVKMERDLDEDDLCMNLQVQTENVALEVEDFIFDRLLDEELSNICKS